MGKFIDRAGVRYGSLVGVRRTTGHRADKVYWVCQCDCGNIVNVAAGDLSTGHTVSCGCYNRSICTKHGGWQKSSYNTWRAMLRRCTNPNDKDYPRYGAKGITVCPEWNEYLKFEFDMGEPEGDQTLDRIDPTKGYDKQNCRWASPATQARNKSPIAHKYGAAGIKPTKSGKWIVSITADHKKHYSRVIQTLSEAQNVRMQMEEKYWGKR